MYKKIDIRNIVINILKDSPEGVLAQIALCALKEYEHNIKEGETGFVDILKEALHPECQSAVCKLVNAIRVGNLDFKEEDALISDTPIYIPKVIRLPFGSKDGDINIYATFGEEAFISAMIANYIFNDGPTEFLAYVLGSGFPTELDFNICPEVYKKLVWSLNLTDVPDADDINIDPQSIDEFLEGGSDFDDDFDIDFETED